MTDTKHINPGTCFNVNEAIKIVFLGYAPGTMLQCIEFDTVALSGKNYVAVREPKFVGEQEVWMFLRCAGPNFWVGSFGTLNPKEIQNLPHETEQWKVGSDIDGDFIVKFGHKVHFFDYYDEAKVGRVDGWGIFSKMPELKAMTMVSWHNYGWVEIEDSNDFCELAIGSPQIQKFINSLRNRTVTKHQRVT